MSLSIRGTPVASAPYLTVTEGDTGSETQLPQPPETMRAQVLRVETHLQQCQSADSLHRPFQGWIKETDERLGKGAIEPLNLHIWVPEYNLRGKVPVTCPELI